MASTLPLSRSDKATLVAVASAEARKQGAAGRITLEAGKRYSTLFEALPPSVNVLLVDGTPDWEDSDLADHVPLAVLAKEGIPATANGRAVVDFYVYGRDGLATNCHGAWDRAGLVAVFTAGPDGDVTLWSRT